MYKKIQKYKPKKNSYKLIISYIIKKLKLYKYFKTINYKSNYINLEKIYF